jgi:starch synthase
MPEPIKILFLSAEVAPFAKSGGLGDIGGSLPKALADMGHEVRVVMPAYKNIEDGYPGVDPMAGQLDVPTGSGVIPCGVFQSTLPDCEVPIFFIAEWQLFKRDNIYGYWDDPYRAAADHGLGLEAGYRSCSRLAYGPGAYLVVDGRTDR